MLGDLIPQQKRASAKAKNAAIEGRRRSMVDIQSTLLFPLLRKELIDCTVCDQKKPEARQKPACRHGFAHADEGSEESLLLS